MKVLSGLLDELLEQPDEVARERWLMALPLSQQPFLPALRRMLQARQEDLAGPLDRPSPFGPASPVAQPALAAGQRVGKYVLLRELGQGGMSEVWLARAANDATARPVALKLPVRSLRSDHFLERLSRERQILARLSHPRIAGLVDAGVDETGQHFLALTFVDGEPLLEHCNRRGLGMVARLDLVLQVLEAVQYAHERQVLHRDLKPSNILVSREGGACLLDFGIAKLLVEGVAHETQLTERWGRALTPAYASPEQVAGLSVTVQSDLYALGVILFELMTGQRPAIAGESQRPIAPPSQSVRLQSAVARAEGGERLLAQRLEWDLDGIILQALQTDPGKRPPDAAALADSLRQARHRLLASSPWPQRAWSVARSSVRRQRRAILWTTPAWVVLAVAAPVHPMAAAIETWLLSPPPTDQRVVLVTIGAEDHRRLFGGRRPLDAPLLQALVLRILEGQPARVGVDIDTSSATFAPLPGALGRDALDRIVWAREMERTGDERAPRLRPLLGTVEPSGDVHGALAMAPADSGNAALRWYEQAIDTTAGRLPTLGAALAGRRDGTTATRSIRFAPTERLELPASVVLAAGFQWDGRLRGRTVLLGGRYDPTDEHATPLGQQPGVEVLAHIVETETAGGGYERPGIAARLSIGVAPAFGTVWAVDRWGGRRGLMLASCLWLAGVGLFAASGVFEAWSYGLVAWMAAPVAALVSRR